MVIHSSIQFHLPNAVLLNIKHFCRDSNLTIREFCETALVNFLQQEQPCLIAPFTSGILFNFVVKQNLHDLAKKKSRSGHVTISTFCLSALIEYSCQQGIYHYERFKE